MHIEKVDIADGIQVALCEIPGMIDYSDSACCGFRYLMSNVRSDNRRREIFVVNLLVKELFGDSCELKHRKSGAPYLERGEARAEVPEISISHCHGMVALAFGSRRMGVDIEVMDERVMRVRERIQSDAELSDTGKSIVANTIAWTSKEALYKLLDRAGLRFREDIICDFGALDVKAAKNCFCGRVLGEEYSMVSLTIDDMVLTTAFK